MKERCAVCGREFSDEKYKKTCSNECQQVYRHRQLQEWREDKKQTALECEVYIETFAKTEDTGTHNKEYSKPLKKEQQKKSTRTCQVCGKKLIRPGKIKICSECRTISEKEQQKRTTIKCPVCGEKFVQTRNEKTCSGKCREIFKRIERIRRPYTCDLCGKTFIKSEPYQKYCSSECKEIAKSRVNIKEYVTNKIYLKHTNNDNKKLSAESAEARKLGLTYGELKSQQFLTAVGSVLDQKWAQELIRKNNRQP